MAGRKRERYKIEPGISVPFMLELEYESKIIKKTISDQRNMFLAASWVGWTESLHRLMLSHAVVTLLVLTSV